MTADTKEMSFFGHLEELRKRLFRMAAAVILVAVVLFFYTEWIIDTVYIAMSKPGFITYRAFCKIGKLLDLQDTLCANEIKLQFQSIKMTGQFSTNIYFSFVGGIVLSFPYLFLQVWGFVKPGLKKNETSATKGIVLWASLLFLCGIFFGYFIIAPLTVQFFGNYTMSQDIMNIPTIGDYIGIITATTFWTGLLFELPVVIYILTKIGIVGPEFLRTYRKHAVVVVLILSAVITPPDFFSQIIVSIPILILYEISIFVSARTEKARIKSKA
ncbi:MAG: twin-arginine translocase subunit TatC [Flavobacteriales bacterium]